MSTSSTAVHGDVPADYREAISQLQSVSARISPMDVPIECTQELMLLAVRTYFAQRDAGLTFCPFPTEEAVNATEVVVAVSNMLEAAEVELFELAMCQGIYGPAPAQVAPFEGVAR